MKVCRYFEPQYGPCLGVVENEVVHNATATGWCGSIAGFLAHHDPWQLAEAVVAAVPAGRSLASLDVAPDPNVAHLLAPIDLQEVWACGVTYIRSRQAREQESTVADIYTRVYDAERPEIFFKSTPHRTVGPNTAVTIREDSTWDVPEPELALVLSPSLKLIGYTAGNDMSSRSIEGDNPLYLPQAKVWNGACALGPVITLIGPSVSEFPVMDIRLKIARGGETMFAGESSTQQIKRKQSELVEYLGRANTFPHGVFLLTGTGIVPGDDFTLQPGDEVEIDISHIGTLRNSVARAASRS